MKGVIHSVEFTMVVISVALVCSLAFQHGNRKFHNGYNLKVLMIFMSLWQ